MRKKPRIFCAAWKYGHTIMINLGRTIPEEASADLLAKKNFTQPIQPDVLKNLTVGSVINVLVSGKSIDLITAHS